MTKLGQEKLAGELVADLNDNVWPAEEPLTTLDLLDCLAMCGLKLVRDRDGMTASDAYMASLQEEKSAPPDDNIHTRR